MGTFTFGLLPITLEYFYSSNILNVGSLLLFSPRDSAIFSQVISSSTTTHKRSDRNEIINVHQP